MSKKRIVLLNLFFSIWQIPSFNIRLYKMVSCTVSFFSCFIKKGNHPFFFGDFPFVLDFAFFSPDFLSSDNSFLFFLSSNSSFLIRCSCFFLLALFNFFPPSVCLIFTSCILLFCFLRMINTFCFVYPNLFTVMKLQDICQMFFKG